MIEAPELTFVENGHLYYLDGVNIPSVSKIIEPVSGDAYSMIDPIVLARAAARGTEVHKAIENYNTIGIVEISDEHAGYVNAYLDWAESRKPEVLESEAMFYHKKFHYAGTADMIAIIDNKLTLVDFKTSRNVVSKNYRLQLAAYVDALKTFGIDIERKLILHLKNDGTYTEHEFDIADKEALDTFRACKTVYDYINKGKRKINA